MVTYLCYENFIKNILAVPILLNMKNVKKLSEQELHTGHKTSWHDQYRDSAWVFVGGLPYDLTEGDIVCVFSQWGEIVNINLIRTKDTGKSRGFCFICYEDQRSTDLAVDNFNGIKILNRTIRVDHVSEYKVPKDGKKTDSETKKLYDEGCAPKTQPISKVKTEPDDVRETLADQIVDGVRLPPRLPIYAVKEEPNSEIDYTSDSKKSKKAKKSKKSNKSKKRKKNRKKNNSSESSSNDSSVNDSTSSSDSSTDEDDSGKRNGRKHSKSKKKDENKHKFNDNSSRDDIRSKTDVRSRDASRQRDSDRFREDSRELKDSRYKDTTKYRDSKKDDLRSRSDKNYAHRDDTNYTKHDANYRHETSKDDRKSKDTRTRDNSNTKKETETEEEEEMRKQIEVMKEKRRKQEEKARKKLGLVKKRKIIDDSEANDYMDKDDGKEKSFKKREGEFQKFDDSGRRMYRR